jgi:hypothetical protein
VFRSRHDLRHGGVLTACALRRAGYKHLWAVGGEASMEAVRVIAPCRFEPFMWERMGSAVW